jgi:hypothetical protein
MKKRHNHKILDTSKKTVLFVDTAYYVDFYLKINEQLKKDGICIFVVTFSRLKALFYEKKGVFAHHIDLNKRSQKGNMILRELENYDANYRVNQSLKNDRFLRWRSRRYGLKILESAAYGFDQLLSLKSPSLIIGEISTAIEYLMYFLSQKRGVPYRHLLNLPGKEALITFFDYQHSALGTSYVGFGIPDDRTISREINYEVLCKRVKNKNSGLFSFLRQLPFVYSANDYRTHLIYKFRYFLKPAYFVFYLLIEAIFKQNLRSGARKIFIALHVQPESTPDFVSMFHADQLKVVELISQTAPFDVEIYVKEHPNVLSMRNPVKLFKLLMEKNIKLLPRNQGAFDIIKEFDCVVTIAGTVAMQAAMNGIPTLIFSDIFFKELPNVIDARKFLSVSEAIEAAFNSINSTKPLTEVEIDKWLRIIGFPGYFHDPRLVHEVLSDENINNISNLIKIFMRKFSEIKKDQDLSQKPYRNCF